MRLSHERRIQFLALLAGLPAVAVSMALLWWLGGYSLKVQLTFTVLVVGFWLGFALNLPERVATPLRTIANLLEAMREGDYSIRARRDHGEDALGEVIEQVNAIGATLQQQRFGAIEAATLLKKVMEEINVAVFAFDSVDRLKLVNRAGERLLGEPAERLLDRTATELDLQDLLTMIEPSVERTFPGSSGRWGVNRSVFREEGLPLRLLVLTDVTRALREEELQAWQRIVRVLGHELNNSLTPIKSIAGSLSVIIEADPLAEDWREDARRGLEIIATRSEGLSKFLAEYARLAKLPRPRKAPVALRPLLDQVSRLETRTSVSVSEGPHIVIDADAAQLEQALINLVRNAVDASVTPGSRVWIEYSRNHTRAEIRVLDEGPGLGATKNLFVPFFTTKPGGTGIGLVLSRQIAEAHGGSLTLSDRRPGPGCEAKLSLPLA
jgi:nitrogen fixation/metabolism regulation signal transduction histidine kinase